MGIEWKPDHLGPGFRYTTLPLPADDEGPCEATLVKYEPSRRAGTLRSRIRRTMGTAIGRPSQERAVLYVHGWSDYFFQRELAEFLADEGRSFYALDLRKYGRSLRAWQTPGYVDSLADYDADIRAALDTVREDLAEQCGGLADPAVTMMAHSTGGLVAALWAHRFPGKLAGLVLNSPWLDVQGSALVRATTQGLLEPVARFRPKARLKLPEFGFYWRSICNRADGEWELDPRWRPEFGFPVRAGWLNAVLAGHAQVARGLCVDTPILVLSSARSTISPVWSEAMLASDVVLDVTLMGQRALQLGPHVTVRRFEDALHDVLLSRREVRAGVYADLGAWLRCYGVRAPSERTSSTAPP
jgi:alpha-beta hydrolase superfamily lysophospholipase